jgi:pyridoxal phosphate enzyme (YggS family)
MEVAAKRAGRSIKDVRLVVVTKGHSLKHVQAAIDAGACDLGENYPVEGSKKILAIPKEHGVQWHMIGHVQSRKARLVCENFNMLHSLDRLKLAQRLNRIAGELECRIPVLLQFNVSGEPTKHGWMAVNDEHWDALLPELDEIISMSNLTVCGLMTMPPLSALGKKAIPFFVHLRRLRDFLSAKFPNVCWDHLSMGMSSDFEYAIQEGATLVRIGQAILGPRE